MSQENVDRMRAGDRAKSQRTLAERIVVRWPGLARGTMRSVLHLRPGSRARNAALQGMAERAFRAWNRGDFELVPDIDDPAVETRLARSDRAPLGLDAVYYGPEGHCRAMETWNDAWRTWDAEIDEIIDEGRDRVVVVARLSGEGAASGVRLDEWAAVRYTFREGRILRVDAAFVADREHALDALPVTR